AEVGEFKYDSFGNIRAATGGVTDAGGDFRFQGQWLDEGSDFYHFRARYYDPEVGRFMSRDPVDIIEYEPESSNPSQFVYNNPHVYSDPSGMFTITELNAAQNIKRILESIKGHVTQEIKEEITNEIKGIAADWVISMFKNEIPGVDINNHTMDGISLSNTENPFEMAVTNTFCDVIRSQMPNFFGLDYLWFQPSIDKDGTPSHPGFNPSSSGSGCGVPFTQIGGSNKPELIIKNGAPTDTSSRSYLLTEVKVNVDNKVKPKSKGSQFDTFLNYASPDHKRMYVPIVLYVSLKKSIKKEPRMKKAGLDKGVLVEVVDFGF
ncbi:MAG: RHS repeat-associated core domain-containing protein, partial [Spirulinaceae cyanobacterium]